MGGLPPSPSSLRCVGGRVNLLNNRSVLCWCMLGYMNSVSSFIAHALFALMEIICMHAGSTGQDWSDVE